VRYLGGKSRLGKKIADVIHRATPRREHYLEPFLGGGGSFVHIAPHFQNVSAGDIHEDLILMWQAVAAGWQPPTTVTEEEYRALRHAPPSALRGFVGFGCSFGGKWWGGYARDRARRNYAAIAGKSLLLARCHVERATIEQRGFDGWQVDYRHVVYADPPYRNCTGYRHKFDHNTFWEQARQWSVAGAHVFVSEYSAPADWRDVWSTAHWIKSSGGTRGTATERLFVHESILPELTLD
jgi:DNA adenine methylase